MGYVKFRKVNNVLYHKCTVLEHENGICEFETSDDGVTGFRCRSCGESFDLGNLTQDVAMYYVEKYQE